MSLPANRGVLQQREFDFAYLGKNQTAINKLGELMRLGARSLQTRGLASYKRLL